MEDWSFQTLEFDVIKNRIAEYADTIFGQESVFQIKPVTEEDEVVARLEATKEGMDFLRIKGEVSLHGLRDIRAYLQRISIGGVLDEAACYEVATTIQAGRRIKSTVRQLDKEKAELPRLRGLAEAIHSLDELEQEILDVIDEQLFVKDDATPELAKIRRRLRQFKERTTRTLQQLIRNPRMQKILQDPIITTRNDRYVVPVKADFRGSFPGIIHDQSASGATLFIEPESIVELNYQIQEQELQEKREVEQILQNVSHLIGQSLDQLQENLSYLQEIDFLLTLARFGHANKAVVPFVQKKGFISLYQARHPLLDPEEAVPIDIRLEDGYQAILITGPNTGGKTVTLKTVGLFALMTQCGFPILAQEGSSMPIYEGIYADIGDEQSITQSLSTFSGHMTHIIQILEQLQSNSLILLDELGAGTDPTEGAALAIAIVERMMDQGSTVIATTHYGELKLFAHSHPKAINASVEFDVKTLRPTFRLLIGVPGQSNAFAISNRLGLPPAIIKRAQSLLSQEENELETMIQQLSEERKIAREKRLEADAYLREAQTLQQELKQKLTEWMESKVDLQQRAKQEARSIVRQAQHEAESVIQELQAWSKEKKSQTIKEHHLSEARKRLNQAIPDWKATQSTKAIETQTESYKEGEEVFVTTLQQKGVIIEVLNNEEYLVQMGPIKMKVGGEVLQKQRTSRSHSTTPTLTLQRRTTSISSELDLRGKLVEESIAEIDKYLDEAILAGFQQVTLIHGKGTGALRKGVQRYLQKHPNVQSYRLGAHNEGGSGVTVVEIKT